MFRTPFNLILPSNYTIPWSPTQARPQTNVKTLPSHTPHTSTLNISTTISHNHILPPINGLLFHPSIQWYQRMGPYPGFILTFLWFSMPLLNRDITITHPLNFKPKFLYKYYTFSCASAPRWAPNNRLYWILNSSEPHLLFLWSFQLSSIPPYKNFTTTTHL